MDDGQDKERQPKWDVNQVPDGKHLPGRGLRVDLLPDLISLASEVLILVGPGA